MPPPSKYQSTYDHHALLIIFSKHLHRQNINQAYDPHALLVIFNETLIPYNCQTCVLPICNSF
jgi:hypothetical protein